MRFFVLVGDKIILSYFIYFI